MLLLLRLAGIFQLHSNSSGLRARTWSSAINFFISVLAQVVSV